MKFLITISLVLLFTACSTTTNIYLVRHAEKVDSSPASGLTAQGTARALALKDVMQGVKLNGIFSTAYNRTIKTAEPTATAKNLHVIRYTDGNKLTDSLLLQKGKNFLIIGHSNTLPDMLRHAGLDPGYTGNLPDGEYDNIYRINVHRSSGKPKLKLIKTKYTVTAP